MPIAAVVALLVAFIVIGALARATVLRPHTTPVVPEPTAARPTERTLDAPATRTTARSGGQTVPTVIPSFSATPTARPPTGSSPTSQPADLASLQRLMLDAINRDRAQRSLSAVAWDDTAALAGVMQANEMAQNGFLSHWNMAGYGPDHRYSQLGGRDVVRENVYTFKRTWSDGSAAPITNWSEVIMTAQQSLMSSPGHQANILAPEHTHVGVGIAYNAQTGEVYLAQEFVDRYVRLDAIGATSAMGTAIVVSGKLLNGASTPLLNVAFEPFPAPMTAQQLKLTGTYQSPAVIIEAANPGLDGSGGFSGKLRLGSKGPGLYHLRVWVKAGERDVQAANVVVTVR